jgi:hypothetical protein
LYRTLGEGDARMGGMPYGVPPFFILPLDPDLSSS